MENKNERIYCCENMKSFCEIMNKIYLTIGDGEISGSIDLNLIGEVPKLSIDDGWNFIPELTFNYCPYCGSKEVLQKIIIY